MRLADAIKRASRLRRRFGASQMNSHGPFGVRRLVAAIAPAPKGKRRQVAALHVGLVICPSLARSRSRNRLAVLIALAWSLTLALALPAQAQADKPPPGH